MGVKKKTTERVEFMYQGAAPVDREEYLLGKKVDKAVELDTKDDLNIGNAPGAAFVHGNANTAMDLSKKVRAHRHLSHCLGQHALSFTRPQPCAHHCRCVHLPPPDGFLSPPTSWSCCTISLRLRTRVEGVI